MIIPVIVHLVTSECTVKQTVTTVPQTLALMVELAW